MPIQRGDIYVVNLNPVQGREQAGQRPVLVLSIDAINRLPLVVTVVVGTKGENITRDYPTNVRLSPAESGLPMETVFLGFQVTLVRPQAFFESACRARHRCGAQEN
jgi:mRNA interferase MazF